jgi:hypothetical protein
MTKIRTDRKTRRLARRPTHMPLLRSLAARLEAMNYTHGAPNGALFLAFAQPCIPNFLKEQIEEFEARLRAHLADCPK